MLLSHPTPPPFPFSEVHHSFITTLSLHLTPETVLTNCLQQRSCVTFVPNRQPVQTASPCCWQVMSNKNTTVWIGPVPCPNRLLCFIMLKAGVSDLSLGLIGSGKLSMWFMCLYHPRTSLGVGIHFKKAHSFGELPNSRFLDVSGSRNIDNLDY